MMNKIIARQVLVIFTIACFLSGWPQPSHVQASAGDLDPTFGNGGKVNTDFLGGLEEARAVAIQSDGRIVAAGFAATIRGDANFAVVRYNENGTLDSTFGDGGKVSTDFIEDSTDQGFDLILQPDGRIVVAGLTLQDVRSDRRVLARIDTCLKRATASIQVFSQGTTQTITDRNTTNNSCACQ